MIPAAALTHSATGADLIVGSLERQGVTVVAGIPGGALLPVYAALARSEKIRHILARHEQAAGFIAQGMARITHRAGVCLATSGPGVTNIVTALADAKLDSIPLVCIAGQVPTHLIGTDAFQEVATLDLVKPVTKAAFFANSADELESLIDAAFQIAQSGRPGPVLIDIPKDVQLQPSNQCSAPHRSEPPCAIPQENPLALDAAAALIRSAERPMVYVGGGVIKARAEHLLRRFAESAALPVVTTLMAMGALPHDHPLNLGMLGMHGSRATHLALESCDVLIAVGARFDDRATGDPQRFVPNARIIHIDIDRRELGKIKTPAIALHTDAAAALTQLLRRDCGSARSAWLQRVCGWRSSQGEHGSSHPLSMIRCIGAQLPADTLLTTDVGQHQMWVAQAYPFARADRWLTSGGLGTMGFGLPAAIGAALARPEATAVCFTGDGSLLMNIQELATLAELGLNVKIVLFDNASLGMVRQQQQLFYQRRYYASYYQRASDFIAIARAFGVAAIEFEDTEPGRQQLQQLLRAPGPALIRIQLDDRYNVSPMVGPGAANIEALDCERCDEL